MATTLNAIVDMTRKLILDFAIFNELRGRPEFSDDTIRLCAILTLDDYNSSPPFLAPSSFETFPSENLLILGTIKFLMMQSMLNQTRNQLSYQDGGRGVALHDKGPAYTGLFNMFTQLYESKKAQIKVAKNLEGGFGILRSAEFSVYSLMTGFANEFISPVAFPDPISAPAFSIATPTNTRSRTEVIPFTKEDWHTSEDGLSYEMTFVHGLPSKHVAIILEDPTNGKDITNRMQDICRLPNSVVLSVPLSPDSRIGGTIQCFVP